MTEAQFQDAIVQMARLLGWKVAHFRPARTQDGWRTPVAADAVGWPDLCLVRDRVVWLECKSATGRVSAAQADWIARLNAAGGTALVVRPKDMGEIEQALKRRSPKVAA